MTPDEYIDTTLQDLAAVYSGARVLAHAQLLFGASPSCPSRITDPGTSHDAGDRFASRDVGRFGAKSRTADLLRFIAAAGGGLTAQEAARMTIGVHATMSAFDGCRRRVSDLVAAGFIRDSGRRRQNVGSPDQSIVWEVTTYGLAALARLDRTGWSKERVA